MQITGIVIAGGKSSRMGENKALIVHNGQRLIDKAIQTIKPLCNELIISSNEHIPSLNYSIISDQHKSIGPMGGLHACLSQSKTDFNLLIPCDVPSITTAVYEKLLEKVQDYDVVLARHKADKVEPLIAIYKTSVLAVIKEQIILKDYKMMHLLKRVKVCYVDFEESSFFKNMNSPKDLK